MEQEFIVKTKSLDECQIECPECLARFNIMVLAGFKTKEIEKVEKSS